MIKVAITDDHPVVLAGLQQMLIDCSNISLCGTYLTGNQLLEGLQINVPDVLLLDLQLPDLSEEEVVGQVLRQFPDIRILVLTSIEVTYKVNRMLELGCAGYSLKNVSRSSLLYAIEKVHQGQEYIDPVLQEEMAKEMRYLKKTHSSMPSNVTRREKEILNLLSLGNTSQQIADKLFLSVRTIENHRKSLLHKFNVQNTVGLLNIATKMAFIR